MVQLLNHLTACEFPATRRLMVGILVSSKSMQGEALKPEWAAQYPEPTAIAGLIVPDRRAIYLAHYNTKSLELADELCRVLELAPELDGFQLNVSWPHPGQLEKFRKLYPDKLMVVQLGSKALAAVGCSEDEPRNVSGIRNRLAIYVGLVDHLLLDRSGGLGHAFDPLAAAETISAVNAEADFQIGMGIGGGLSCQTVGTQIMPCLRVYPELSWDAQGKLLGEGGHLDIDLAASYLTASAQALRDLDRVTPIV